MHPLQAFGLTLACGMVVFGIWQAVAWAAGKVVDGIFWGSRTK